VVEVAEAKFVEPSQFAGKLMAAEFVEENESVLIVQARQEFVEKFPIQKGFVELKQLTKEFVGKFLIKTEFVAMSPDIARKATLAPDMNLVLSESLCLEMMPLFGFYLIKRQM